MDEIFRQRAEYLVNPDEYMIEMFGEPDTGISKRAHYHSGLLR